MPTFRSAERRVQVTGGQNVNMHTDKDGTRVSFNGTITFNGQPLASPAQLRKEWAESGQVFLADADDTDGVAGQERQHYRARAKALAYATAIDLMDKIGTDDLAQLAEAMRLTAAEVRRQVAAQRAAMSDVQHENALKGADHLEALAAHIDTAATVTWIEQ